jgi:hypothetical protein
MPAPSCTPARARRASAVAQLHGGAPKQALALAPAVRASRPVCVSGSSRVAALQLRCGARQPRTWAKGVNSSMHCTVPRTWRVRRAHTLPQTCSKPQHAAGPAGLILTCIIAKEMRRCRPYGHAHCAAAAAPLQQTTARRRGRSCAVSVARPQPRSERGRMAATGHPFRDNACDNERRQALRRAVVCCICAAAAAQ